MNIFRAIGIARQHVVEGGALGPHGDLGKMYLKAAHELLLAGVGVFDEIENEIFNEESKLHEFLGALKAKADAKVKEQEQPQAAPQDDSGSKDGPSLGSTVAVPPLVAQESSTGGDNPGIPNIPSGSLDSSQGPTF